MRHIGFQIQLIAEFPKQHFGSIRVSTHDLIDVANRERTRQGTFIRNEVIQRFQARCFGPPIGHLVPCLRAKRNHHKQPQPLHVKHEPVKGSPKCHWVFEPLDLPIAM